MRKSDAYAMNGRNVGNGRVYLDSNVFIYALEGDETTAELVMSLLSTLRSKPKFAVTSELTLAEILVIPETARKVGLRRKYLDLVVWSGVFDLRPVSREVLIESARYRLAVHPGKPAPREDRRNFLPDAIHVVTAIQNGCEFFVARDKRLKLPRGLTQILPDTGGIPRLLKLLS